MNYSALVYTSFEQLAALKARTGDYKLTHLFGLLKFQTEQTRLPNKAIARTREQLANMMYCGVSTLDRMLDRLVELGLIEVKIGMWKGNKRLFIVCKCELNLNIDMDKLYLMNEYTGGNRASALLAYFAYKLQGNNTFSWVRNGNKRAVLVYRHEIAALLGVSQKSVGAFVKRLVAMGCIEAEGRLYRAKRCFAIHLNPEFYAVFEQELAGYKETKKAKKLAKLEKTKESIIINQESKIQNINNNTSNQLIDQDGAIILSKKEQNYLSVAVKRTVAKSPRLDWGLEVLIAQVKYAMSNVRQRKGTQNFVHAVNRVMKLIREGAWKVPFGWFKYTYEGKREAERMQDTNYTFTKKGRGTIRTYDYGVDARKDEVPSTTAIFEERNRLSKLNISLEEKNQSLKAKFGWYAESHLLRA